MVEVGLVLEVMGAKRVVAAASMVKRLVREAGGGVGVVRAEEATAEAAAAAAVRVEEVAAKAG